MSEVLVEAFFRDGGGVDLRNFDLGRLTLMRFHVARYMSCVVDGEMKNLEQNDVELLAWLHCTNRLEPLESTAGVHANIYVDDESGIVIRKSTAGLYLDGVSDIIMNISAHGHEDRTHSMTQRLKKIATVTKALFGNHLTVLLKFNSIQPGCWYSA
jgi:hypothetical protein